MSKNIQKKSSAKSSQKPEEAEHVLEEAPVEIPTDISLSNPIPVTEPIQPNPATISEFSQAHIEPSETPVENKTEATQPDQKEQETFSLDDSEDNDNKGSKKVAFIIVIVALVAFSLGAVAGGLVVYRQNVSNANNQAAAKDSAPSKQTESSPTPEPTAAPVDLTKYKIKVLNGSDTKGAAGSLKDDLTKAGFNVSSTGNATNSAFIKTVISTKKEVDSSYIAKLKDFLSKSHVVSLDQDLQSNSESDVVVIVGAE